MSDTQNSTTDTGDESWTCGKCQAKYAKKDSKLLVCDYCGIPFCIKCVRINDTTYKGVSGREDFPWFCGGCILKTKKLIKEERDIEAKCQKFLENFQLKVESRFDDIQTELNTIKEKLDKIEPNSGATAQPEDVMKRMCTNINERLNRQKNILIFNLPEEFKREEVQVTDDELIKDFLKLTTGKENMETNNKRLGRKATGEGNDVRHRPIMISFKKEEEKQAVMSNLRKLKNATKPLDKISVRNDMSKEEREEERKLREDVKRRNEASLDPNSIWILKGPPWDRKVERVPKRVKERKTATEEEGAAGGTMT